MNSFQSWASLVQHSLHLGPIQSVQPQKASRFGPIAHEFPQMIQNMHCKPRGGLCSQTTPTGSKGSTRSKPKKDSSMLKRLIALALTSIALAVPAPAQISDPNCACAYSIGDGIPLDSNCGYSLELTNVITTSAPCTPPPGCEWVSPSACRMTIGKVEWVQTPIPLTTIVAAEFVDLRAGCGSVNGAGYRCPNNPSEIWWILLECQAGCTSSDQ
jgi:hypothetical protein